MSGLVHHFIDGLVELERTNQQLMVAAAGLARVAGHGPVAVEEGATLVRLGTVLFGARG